MSEEPRILVFSGSLRQASFNRRLAEAAARGAEQAGATCTRLDLRDHALPPYDGDLEAREGLPPGARALRER